jgi:hypothetical protein
MQQEIDISGEWKTNLNERIHFTLTKMIIDNKEVYHLSGIIKHPRYDSTISGRIIPGTRIALFPNGEWLIGQILGTASLVFYLDRNKSAYRFEGTYTFQGRSVDWTGYKVR